MLFDIAPSEMLLTVGIAVVVIGPKDLPLALRTAGRWMGKMRRVSGHFRQGIETMIREAELADMEKKWREQNASIMQAHPADTPVAPALIEHAPTAPFQPDEPLPDFAARRSAAMESHVDLPLSAAVPYEPELPPAPAPPAPAEPADHPAD